jgi:hypothetical protein
MLNRFTDNAFDEELAVDVLLIRARKFAQQEPRGNA